jgi:hypothetical protein
MNGLVVFFQDQMKLIVNESDPSCSRPLMFQVTMVGIHFTIEWVASEFFLARTNCFFSTDTASSTTGPSEDVDEEIKASMKEDFHLDDPCK